MSEEFYKDIIQLKVSENDCIGLQRLYLEVMENEFCLIELELSNSTVKIVKETFWDCLSELKRLYPNIILHCKGYKKNVYPSRMTWEMSFGLRAYEMELGQQATFDDLVSIFSPEDDNLTSSIQAQIEYRDKWLNSLQ